MKRLRKVGKRCDSMILVAVSDFDNLPEILGGLGNVQLRKTRGIEVYRMDFYEESVVFADIGGTKAQVAMNLAGIGNEYPLSAAIVIGNTADIRPDRMAVSGLAVAQGSLQYDANYAALGCPKGMVPGTGQSAFSFDPHLVRVAQRAAEKCGILSQCGRMISGDRFVADRKKAEHLRSQYGGDYLDTECGVAGEWSYRYAIPAVAVKGISNYADKNAVKDYRRFRRQANQQALKAAVGMVNELIAC